MDLPALLDRHYALRGELRPLRGAHRNFRLDADDGRQFVVKVSAADVQSRAELEQAVVDRAAPALGRVALPRGIANTSGALATLWTTEGDCRWVRVLTFLNGLEWEHATSASPARLRALGCVLGILDR